MQVDSSDNKVNPDKQVNPGNSTGGPRRPANRLALLGGGVAIFLIGGLIGAVVAWRVVPNKSPAVSAAAAAGYPVLGTLSEFALVDSAGEPISREDLLGRVWVADFFFTSCSGICPMMSRRMAELQTALDGVEEVTLVSISVDPERDTPARLKAYSRTYNADPLRWWFLTGERSVIYLLSRESFRLGVEETPEDQRGPGVEDVLHSSKFVLLDRSGRIRGYYDGEDPATVEMLVSDIRWLLSE